jgi:hypothetical protein
VGDVRDGRQSLATKAIRLQLRQVLETGQLRRCEASRQERQVGFLATRVSTLLEAGACLGDLARTRIPDPLS